MKTMLTLLLTLSLSAALLLGCTASAQSAADMEAGPAYASSAQQPETLVRTNSETYDQEGGAAVLANVPVAQVTATASAVYHDLCAVCADEDCDGGEHCTNADQQEENGKSNTPCKTCGDDACDGGTDCSGRNGHHNNHQGSHHNRG